MNSDELVERLEWVRANLRRTDAENIAYYPDMNTSLGGVLDGVIAELTRLRAQVPEWISVDDRLPTEEDYGVHERVLVRYRYTDVPGREWSVGDSYHDAAYNRWNKGWQFGSCDFAEVSHWMRFDGLLSAAPTPQKGVDGG